jgi:hypothetical protein
VNKDTLCYCLVAGVLSERRNVIVLLNGISYISYNNDLKLILSDTLSRDFLSFILDEMKAIR